MVEHPPVVGMAGAGLPPGDFLLADIALGQVQGPLLQRFHFECTPRGGRVTEHKSHLIYNTVLTTVIKEIVKVISIIVYEIIWNTQKLKNCKCSMTRSMKGFNLVS